MTGKRSFWLRCEKKKYERRAALTPTTAKRLIEGGFEIFVERDEQRIFKDEEYAEVGCKLVENDSWSKAPKDVAIIGLKELPESKSELEHTHIYFGHCYKNQAGWKELLTRFQEGGGKLYDLEYLEDDNGRRVAAFGYHAGFAGAAVGILAYGSQRKGETLGLLTPYDNEKGMLDDIRSRIGGNGRGIKALVIGALGRCGRGAVALFRAIGLNEEDIVQWDMAETAKGGPFEEILDVDIFVNCIYLNSKIAPFITTETIKKAGRRLSVVVDVSCDTTNANNPVPIYRINTTFDKPTVQVGGLEVVSIDHLPTLLPREASEQFSGDLVKTLEGYPDGREWVEAEKLYRIKAL